MNIGFYLPRIAILGPFDRKFSYKLTFEELKLPLKLIDALYFGKQNQCLFITK